MSFSFTNRQQLTAGWLIALILLVHQSWAQPIASAPVDSIDAIVQAHMKSKHVPGVSIAIVRQGKVVFAKGYGLANAELNVPATPQSVYAIASVSKQFIATGIMILAQEGKLKLDDDIHNYYPTAPQTWQGITLQHLLSHTSGLVREGPAFNPSKIQPGLSAALAVSYWVEMAVLQCRLFCAGRYYPQGFGATLGNVSGPAGIYANRYECHPHHNPQRAGSEPRRWLLLEQQYVSTGYPLSCLAA